MSRFPRAGAVFVTTALAAVTASAIVSAFVVVVAQRTASAAAVVSFRPITPTRAIDTRETSTPLAPQEVRVVNIVGVGGVPADAVAVSLNVTVIDPDGPGYLTVFPGGTARPLASNLNFVSNQLASNMVLTGLGSAGGVGIFNGSGGTAEVVVDIAGWYSSGFHAIAPTRLMDTRSGLGGDAIGQAQTRTLKVAGTAGVPATATAVALNVTVTEPTSASFVTVWPAGITMPVASNLNFVPGQTVPNIVVSGVSESGSVELYNHGGTSHLVVDVTGWFDNGYHAVTPARVMDTRAGRCLLRLGPGQTRLVQIAGLAGVPATAAAVTLNVTAVNPTTTTFLTLWPSGTPQPLASNLNPITGIVANMASVGLGTDGRVALYNQRGTVEVLIDVTGWFEGEATVATNSPCADAVGSSPAAPDNVLAPSLRAPLGAARFGQSSEVVSNIQQRLLDIGFWVADTDGYYGQVTSQAVMAFQKWKGLRATGNLTEYDAFLLAMESYRPRGVSRAGDLIEVDKGRQLLHLIRGGATIWTVNTSTGSDIPYEETNQRDGGIISGDAHTPTGRFRVYRIFSDGWESGQLGELYRPRYFNGGIAVHGAPSIPNFPASHGCVRVTTTFMDWIWDANQMPLRSEVWVHD